MKKIVLMCAMICITTGVFAIDLTIKDIPTQRQANRIKASAMNIIAKMEKANMEAPAQERSIRSKDRCYM